MLRQGPRACKYALDLGVQLLHQTRDEPYLGVIYNGTNWNQTRLSQWDVPWMQFVFSGNVSIKEDKFSNWFSNVIIIELRILKPSQSERSPTLDAHNQKRTFSISDLVWDAGRLGFKIALNIIPDCTRKPKTKTHELGTNSCVSYNK